MYTYSYTLVRSAKSKEFCVKVSKEALLKFRIYNTEFWTQLGGSVVAMEGASLDVCLCCSHR